MDESGPFNVYTAPPSGRTRHAAPHLPLVAVESVLFFNSSVHIYRGVGGLLVAAGVLFVLNFRPPNRSGRHRNACYPTGYRSLQ